MKYVAAPLMLIFIVGLYIGSQVGYREGMKVVWTYETLGKCNVETGVEPQ